MKMKTKLACFICFASMTVTAIMSGYIMYQETYEVIAKEEPVAEVSEADAETNETTPRTYVWTETINELPTSEMKHEFNLSQGKTAEKTPVEEEGPAEEVRIEKEESDVVNFDEVFGYVNSNTMGDEETQYYVDRGYIVLCFDDYYHHNTSKFMDLFWQLKPGKTVIVGGQTYTCGTIEHGYTPDDCLSIYTDSGEKIMHSGTVELITCDGGYDTIYRWIARLY